MRPAKRAARGVAPVQDAGEAEILRLQRTLGNAAVNRLLQTVQRAPVTVRGQTVPGTADEDSTAFRYHLLGSSQKEFDEVKAALEAQAPAPESWNGQQLAMMSEGRPISVAGHGLYSDEYVRKISERDGLGGEPPKKRRRGAPEPVEPTFVVPEGVTLLMYAPHGASINNSVAHDIERGYVPPKENLEIVKSTGKTETVEELPGGDFPYQAGPGTRVPNYRVGRPDRLKVDGKSRTVKDAKLLSQLVEELREEGFSVIQYTCCSATEKEDAALFPKKGWWVRYTESGQEESDEAIKKAHGADAA